MEGKAFATAITLVLRDTSEMCMHQLGQSSIAVEVDSAADTYFIAILRRTLADGTPVLERRAFVVCFDSRHVFVYDPERRRVDAEITTGRGPHALAVDAEHGLLYVGHFTDSYVGVVSLDRRFPRTYGRMLATIGSPSAPRASK